VCVWVGVYGVVCVCVCLWCCLCVHKGGDREVVRRDDVGGIINTHSHKHAQEQAQKAIHQTKHAHTHARTYMLFVVAGAYLCNQEAITEVSLDVLDRVGQVQALRVETGVSVCVCVCVLRGWQQGSMCMLRVCVCVYMCMTQRL